MLLPDKMGVRAKHYGVKAETGKIREATFANALWEQRDRTWSWLRFQVRRLLRTRIR